MKKYKVLFCDLDGTLIDTISSKTFPQGIWDMKFKFDVLDAIRKLTPQYIFISTNQSGIEKGFVDERNFIAKIEFICKAIKEYTNVNVVKYAYYITNDEKFHYRKPNKGALEMFKHDYNADKEDCLMIGDGSGLEGQWSDTDKKTAENFGIDYLDVNEFVKLYSNGEDIRKDK